MVQMWTYAPTATLNDHEQPFIYNNEMPLWGQKIPLNELQLVSLVIDQNTYETYDQYIRVDDLMGPSTEGTFYSINRLYRSTMQTYLNQPNLLMEIQYEISNIKNEYTRKTYSFIDLIGEVGGVFEVFLIVLEAFFMPYYQFLFNSINI